MPPFFLIDGGNGNDDYSEECPYCTDATKEDIDSLWPILRRYSGYMNDTLEAVAENSDIPLQRVDQCLVHLRAHYPWHGWTVPHALRGPSTGVSRFTGYRVNSNGELSGHLLE